MADDVDRQELLSILTTEHFGLQSARGSTVAESSARAAMYLGSLSAALVSLGFVAQISATGDTFRVFALVVLPTLFVLGLFTFVRLVESGVEDIFYGRAINRIRSYYLERAGAEARFLVLTGHDDARGVLRNMGLTPSKRQLYFTTASAIAVVNSVVGGAAVAVALGALVDAPLGLAAGVGGAVAIASAFAWVRYADRLLDTSAAGTEPLFPSP